MISLLARLLTNSVALWVATEIVTGVTVTASTTSQRVTTLAVVALIFGVVNTVIKPIVKLLSLPAYVLTLGLFTFIVNALMLSLTSWVAGKLDVAFHVADFFWSAILGALVISVVSWVIGIVLPK